LAATVVVILLLATAPMWYIVDSSSEGMPACTMKTSFSNTAHKGKWQKT
jgi:hypothetical protein